MKRYIIVAGAFALAAVFVPATLLQSKATTVDKDNVNTAPGWNLGDLYASDAAWTEARDKTKADAGHLESYKGTLGKNAANMLTALDAISHVRKETNRLYVYASLKADEDVNIAPNQERQQAASALQTIYSEKTAWLTPEILSIGEDKVKAFELASPELAHRFGFFLDNTLRAAPHTLGVEAEGVLASAGNVLQQPNAVYSVFANGEVPFPAIRLADGTKVDRLDSQAYAKWRTSPNRADRKKVFDAFWGAWKKYEGTFGANLTTQVMGEVFNAKVRHFPNSLSAALFADNMPEGVYRQLVAQANAGLPTLYRYLLLRKKKLHIQDELAYYDMYPPMFLPENLEHFTVPQAEEMTLAVTAPYGDEYTAMLKKGFAGNWMDVYPRTGKAAGAYMNGSAYDVHPFLHLNHNGDYEALSTFAHEWGHAIHTLLADSVQPYETSDYSTFTAETASISNEMLLNDYVVAHAKTKDEKLYYLGEGLELIRTTFFRQTMFAEFQLQLHEEIEKGNTLSGSRMSELYCGLLKKYYGEAEGITKIDPAYCIEWAFIPHFYYGFYVYQYATSMAGAAQFTDAINSEGAPARDRFIAMLKAGGSDYPYPLYKKAGLDMASPAPYQALIARMNKILDEIDELEK
ncbi:MAG TPA: M3 family oligoendopeptidase [Rhizomicrobium sp.]|nr:M3 family oligoendopeptidase [Rhizomicrobium sp.]